MEFDGPSVTMLLIMVICALGLSGNILILLVILGKKSANSPFYSLLLGLTLSDSLLLGLSLVSTSNHFGFLNFDDSPRYSEILVFLLDWISTSGTRYFTVAVSLERYFVICHPLSAHRLITRKRGVVYTLLVFGFVLVLSTWSYFYSEHIGHDSFEIYSALCLHLIPFLLILVLNVLLYFGLKNYQRTRETLSEVESAEVSITGMLLAIVFVFGISMCFEFIRRIMVFTGYFDFEKYDWYDYTINCLSSVFYVLNSAVNFIIYCFMGKTFYREFLDTVHAWCPFCLKSGFLKHGHNVLDSTVK